MNPTGLTPTAFDFQAIDCDQLVRNGYVIVPDFLSAAHTRLLYQYAQQLPDYEWQQAGIGRADDYSTNTRIRQDKIRWLSRANTLETNYLNGLETLRLQLNRELFMGLFDYECHLAHYPPGAFYRKHLDAFKGRSNRILTTVLYLNPDWSSADGGQLVIYGQRQEILETVLPEAGKLVLFLSDKFVHEVLAGQRDRYSITGWFRLNASIGGVIDPSR